MPARPGRKVKHPKPLDEALKRALARLTPEVMTKQKWAISELLDRLSDFGAETGDDRSRLADFTPDENTMRKLVNLRHPVNDWTMWALFLFLEKSYDNEIEKLQLEEHLKLREEAVKAIRGITDPNHQLNIDTVHALNGSYNLYSPSPVNPEGKIQLMGLHVGDDESKFNCSVKASYMTGTGTEYSSVFTGKIIPSGNKLMAMLAADNAMGVEKDTMILHFDRVGASGRARELSGIMLSAIGMDRSSAWPVVALGTDDAVEPHVLSGQEVLELSPRARELLGRGVVHWEQERFPKSFHSGGAPSP